MPAIPAEESSDLLPRAEFEGQRETLLDVVLAKLQKTGKATILSRLVYVAKLSRRESIADYHKGYLSKLIERHQGDGDVTGILLVYPTCLVHMIEAKSSALARVLHELNSPDPGEHRMQSCRVIYSTEDIPGRSCHAWYCGFVPSSSNIDSVDGCDTHTVVKVAFDVTSIVRKIGSSFAGISEFELRKQLHNLPTFFEDLPQPETLLSLAASEDAPSVSEFLEIFDSPVNLDLETEKVWPLPPPLKY